MKKKLFNALIVMIMVNIALTGKVLSQKPNTSFDAVASKKPNILFIMSDDHATNAISCYGSRLNDVFSTPNIDQLADQGVRLNSCFVTNSICAPSRASILTGQYNHINGVYTLFEPLDPAHPNVAKDLQKAGYETSFIGKWHLKDEPAGFDHYQVLKGQGPYFNPGFRENGLDEDEAEFENRKQHIIEGYTTDIITDLSIKWMNQRDKTKPFLLMVNHKAPHAPFVYAPRHEDAFDGVKIPEPASLFEDLSHRSKATQGMGYFVDKFVERAAKPDYHTGTLDTTGLTEVEKRRVGYQKYLKDYLRTVMAVDESVERLNAYLKNNDLVDNTIVIYTSDQGFFLGEHGYIDKRWMYEESLRMPFIIRYPDKLPAGVTNDDICLNIDFAPTFLDYAGVEIPEYMQGRSFRKVLEGDTPKDWRQAMYYRYWLQTSRPAHFGVRSKNRKLIFFYGQTLGMSPEVFWDTNENSEVGWELYDLIDDPKELNNQYSNPAYRMDIIELKQQLKKYRKKYKDLDDDFPVMQEIIKAYWN